MTKQEEQLSKMYDEVDALLREELSVHGCAFTDEDDLLQTVEQDEFLTGIFQLRSHIRELINAVKEVA